MANSSVEQLAKARALLQKGQKIFLKHDHSPGFLHEMATWQGEYHLAHVQEGYNATTRKFKVLWNRNDNGRVDTYELSSPTQVMLLDNVDQLASMDVQIEDDTNGTIQYSAKIIDMCDDQPGEVLIKWDRGDEELVNISQVSLGCRSRRKRRVQYYNAAVGKKKKEREKRTSNTKSKARNNNIDQKDREEDVEVISLASSSEEESDVIPTAPQENATTEASGNQQQQEDEVEVEREDEVEEEANISDAQDSSVLSFVEDYNYTNDSMETADQGDDSSEAAANTRTCAQGSPAASVRSLRTQGSSTSSLPSVTNDDVSSRKQALQDSSSHGSVYSDGSEEESSLSCSDSCPDKSASSKQATEDISSPGSVHLDEREEESSCPDESVLDSPKIVSCKRVTRKRGSTNPPCCDDENEVVAPEKRVTPQKKTTATSSSSSQEDRHLTKSAKQDGVLLHGFCRTTKQMKDNPFQTIKLVQSILDKAKACKKDSDEFKETVVDANMLLQEILFNLNERTNFVKKPSSDVPKCSANSPKNDGNKSHIVRLAKEFGLSSEQIDDLFSRLNVQLGYYSINDAIPEILQLQNSNSNTSGESGEEEDDNVACAAADNEQEKRHELLGSRVRTVFEDGREYEGTISTVHYRVTYDDGETETFLSEAEAFENLAYNDKVMNDPSGDETRCSSLEIFSGCSLLSTCCKRKGMHVISIDNDPGSNADVKSDFYSDYVKSLLASQIPDYIHASPVCSTYSRLAGGKHRNKNNYNRTPKSHEADGMLTDLYFFFEKALKINDNTTVTIENPKALMKDGNIMKELFEGKLGFKRFEINYCQFGRGDKKPTNIWTNDTKLGNILELIGGKCNCALPHEEGQRKPGPQKNYAALPLKLCQLISSYVHSKHTQLKFEKLLASRGGDDATALFV